MNAISANGLRRKPVFERRYAKELRCAERNADEIGPGFAMLEAIGQHAERESLGVGNRLIARGAIGQDALEVGDLGDPAAILFAVDFDGEVHADWGEGLVAGRASDALSQSSKEVLLSAERRAQLHAAFLKARASAPLVLHFKEANCDDYLNTRP